MQPAARQLIPESRTAAGPRAEVIPAAEDVAGYLREQQITLTYDPAARTLHAGTGTAARTVTLKPS